MQKLSDLLKKRPLDPQEASRRCGDGTACEGDTARTKIVRVTHKEMKRQRAKNRQKNR